MNKIPVFLHIPKNAGTYVLGVTMELFRHYGISKGWRNKIGWNLNLRRILLQKNGTQIATLFVHDPEEVRNNNEIFKPHNSHRYCNLLDAGDLKEISLKNKPTLFSIIIEAEGAKLIKTGLFDSLCNQNNSDAAYCTILREPFDRCQSMYSYITSSSSSHEPTHGAIKFKTFEEYLNSYQLEDSWLIRNLINIPDSNREITEEDYEQACFILNRFKIKDITSTNSLIDDVFFQCYEIDTNTIKNELNTFNKNVTLNKQKFYFDQLNEKTKQFFLNRTKFDRRLYDEFCKKI
jgi:hypothetical protein